MTVARTSYSGSALSPTKTTSPTSGLPPRTPYGQTHNEPIGCGLGEPGPGVELAVVITISSDDEAQ